MTLDRRFAVDELKHNYCALATPVFSPSFEKMRRTRIMTSRVARRTQCVSEAHGCVTEVIHESDVNIHSRDDVWLGIDHVTTGSLSDHEWNVLIVYD
jgi:hypothetical protein